MRMFANNIIAGDCLDYLPQMPNNCADAIICDPPYNIGKNFGNNRDNLPLNEYVAWAGKWLCECLRILKDSGTMFVYGFPEILARLAVTLPIDRQRWLQWHYSNKNMPNLNFWQRSHESILCVWKDKPIFNRDDIREPYTEEFLKGSAGKRRARTRCRLSQGGAKETIYQADDRGALPRDVIRIPALAGGAALKERIIFCKSCQVIIAPQKRSLHITHELLMHPTQKPMRLTRKLLLSCKPKGQFNALVPFCGSGSECRVIAELGGNFTAIEMNEDYAWLARRAVGEWLHAPVE